MDPATLVLGALAAGAGKALQDSAGEDVKTAYAAVRDRVKALFRGNAKAELALAEHEASPEVWEAPLRQELTTLELQPEDPAVTAARHLMELLEQMGAQGRRYAVDARGAQGVQVGDHGTQTNHFAR